MSETQPGKTVVVLGGSTPCGAAAARALGREGANVALGGRDRQRLEEVEAEILALGGGALVLGVHLAKRHHPAHLVEAAVEAFGGVDALLYMARASAPPLRSLDVDAWERSLDVNVRGFVYCLAAALPAMRERGGGYVVVANVEDAGQAPDPLLRAWRAAVRTILEELPQELSDYGIRAAEVTFDARQARDPERCANTIVDALKDPRTVGGEPRIHRF